MDRTRFDFIASLVRDWEGSKSSLETALSILGGEHGSWETLGNRWEHLLGEGVEVRIWLSMVTVAQVRQGVNLWEYPLFDYTQGADPPPRSKQVGDVLEHPDWRFYFRCGRDFSVR